MKCITQYICYDQPQRKLIDHDSESSKKSNKSKRNYKQDYSPNSNYFQNCTKPSYSKGKIINCNNFPDHSIISITSLLTNNQMYNKKDTKIITNDAKLWYVNSVEFRRGYFTLHSLKDLHLVLTRAEDLGDYTNCRGYKVDLLPYRKGDINQHFRLDRIVFVQECRHNFKQNK